MIDLNKQYKTEDGCRVKLFEVLDDKIFGAYRSVRTGWWIQTRWLLGGECVTGGPNLDLVEVKRKIIHKRWANVYEHSCPSYTNREAADRLANDNRLACVEITVEAEEGEGL